MPRPLDAEFSVDDDGRLSEASRRRLAACVRTWGDSRIRIRIDGPARTTAANRFYWRCVIEPIRVAMALAGRSYPAMAVHEYLKLKCLPEAAAYCLTETGEELDYEVRGPAGTAHLTTTRLSRMGFSAYVEACRAHSYTLGLDPAWPEDEAPTRGAKIEDTPLPL